MKNETQAEINVGDIVQFKTECIWNGCSGRVCSVGKFIGVTLPDNVTEMAFQRYEIVLRN